ncbi:Adenine phosphoribosyltransferase 5 [Asimina triloba]
MKRETERKNRRQSTDHRPQTQHRKRERERRPCMRVALQKSQALTAKTAKASLTLPTQQQAMPVAEKEDPRLQAISAAIRVVPHFPKPVGCFVGGFVGREGIMFQDITTLLLHPKAFRDTVDIFVDRYKNMAISVVAGVEARGFLFGPSIALAIGAKFVPLRKPKKLPGEVISEKYVLEYGTDCLEMHVGAVQAGERALIIDDIVATGGTLSAAISLLERAEAEVVECACVIGLPEIQIQERKSRDKR